MRHSGFLGCFKILFDDTIHDLSFIETHLCSLVVCDASSHVPTHPEQIFSYGSYFFVLLLNYLGDALRTRGQEADAKKFATSNVNGVS